MKAILLAGLILWLGCISPALSRSSQLPQDNDEQSSDQHVPIYRVGGPVTPPQAIYSPSPKYTKKARKSKEQGDVVLWLIVTKEGATRNIKVAQSLSPDLDKQAVDAVSTWKFQPAMKDGQQIAVQINVKLQFRLN